MHFMYYETNLAWLVEPFFAYDEDRITAWAETWPEIDLIKDYDGRFRIFPSDALIRIKEWDGDYVLDLPEYRRDPTDHLTEDDFKSYQAYEEYVLEMREYWYIPDQQQNKEIGQTFLEELAWQVGLGEYAVMKILGSTYDCPIGVAYAVVGGESPPTERIIKLDLNDICDQAADLLNQNRLMIGFAAE